jgi:hypothetical protein
VLAYAIGGRAIAELYSCALHETARFEHGTDRSEKFVGVRTVHVESPIASIDRHLVSIVFPDLRTVNSRLQPSLKRK